MWRGRMREVKFEDKYYKQIAWNVEVPYLI